MSERNDAEKIKEIPYGISDYELIRKENYYYVDKTRYLTTVKKAGRYLFFIRPRRFGKSLFLSMMEAYYDIYYKERFEEMFKGTWIYENPTEDRGDYLVLKFNFSLVNPAVELFEHSFLKQVQETALAFIRRYTRYLPKEELPHSITTIKEALSASDILSTLVRLCKDSKQKLYVIIDEYDNFANTILSTSGKDAYEKMTRGAGTFRAFFNVIKGGTDGTGAPFSRLFLTGVSPITLDDVTSGYNIGKNITIEPVFNRMLGFTEKDVTEMVEYYRTKGAIRHTTSELLEIMTQWYGNYRFSEEEYTGMYNSDMVLYFLDTYMASGRIPKDLVDRNVRIDYAKLKHLIIVNKGKTKTSNGNFNRLKEIIEKGRTTAEIKKGFPLEQVTDENNFVSLLFFFGLLTIKSCELNQWELTVPNETIRRLYYDYIKEGYDETEVFSLDLSKYSRLMKEMAKNGQWKPLFDYITGRMCESMSLRDLITGEKSIQAFLNVYLGLSDLYIIHPEKELNKGFADILMEPFLARYEGISYSYLLEIKYTKSGARADDDKVKDFISRAKEQLANYSADEKFKKNIEKTTLIKLVLVFSGHELIYIAPA
ncbi:MAG: AAA family ATPase [bacterium]|nr:AAA family ATPase [bacterium]